MHGETVKSEWYWKQRPFASLH